MNTVLQPRGSEKTQSNEVLATPHHNSIHRARGSESKISVNGVAAPWDLGALGLSTASMKLTNWNDGYVLETDPRREDPLYYYMRDGVWGSGVGLEVDPLYKEHKATEVCIRVFQEHQAREAAMVPAERKEMYHRIIPVLVARFPNWSQVTLHTHYLPDLMEGGSLSEMFAALGFVCPTEVGTNEIICTRTMNPDSRSSAGTPKASFWKRLFGA
jgi:hypothetical protein